MCLDCVGSAESVPVRRVRPGRVRRADRRQRGHLRPIPLSHGGDATVLQDHRSVPQQDAFWRGSYSISLSSSLQTENMLYYSNLEKS